MYEPFNRAYLFLKKIFGSEYDLPGEKSTSPANQSMAVGECPVKVTGIPGEKLERILEIPPKLQRKLESIAGPRRRAVRLERY